MRQIALDTETTGREVENHHRIIEIGAIVLEDRRISREQFQVYLNPQRASDEGALAVHGLRDEFLSDKPLFPDIAEKFLSFIEGAELIIHNAPFDVGFFDYELQRTGKPYGKLSDYCTITDTLPLARKLHPGQRNSLDALCKRYNVDNTHRTLHGALLDAELLARVWLRMTAGQSTLFGEDGDTGAGWLTASGLAVGGLAAGGFAAGRPTGATLNGGTDAASVAVRALPVIRATEAERAAHRQRLAAIEREAGACVWESASESECSA